jgi:hypothetical protein
MLVKRLNATRYRALFAPLKSYKHIMRMCKICHGTSLPHHTNRQKFQVPSVIKRGFYDVATCESLVSLLLKISRSQI